MKAVLFIVAAVVLIEIFVISSRDAPKLAAAKPVVIYRAVPAPAKVDRQVAADLRYLSDVAERNEFRRRWKQTYGTECPQ